MDSQSGAPGAPGQHEERDLSTRVSATVYLSFIAAIILIPTVIHLWAPLSIAIAWAIAYAGCTGTAMLLARTFPMKVVNQVWVTAIGSCMAFVPLSLAAWGEPAEHAWIVAAVGIAYIAADSAHLPYMSSYDWRFGVWQSLVATAAVLVVAAQLVLAIAVFLIMASVINAGSRSHRINLALVDKRRRAEEATRRADDAANHDVLTSVLSRRGITRAIEARLGTSFSVLMFDVDDFKAINDQRGHAAGDKAIVGVAQVLEKRLGEQWKLGRFGGDEFIAIAEGIVDAPKDVANPISVKLRTSGSLGHVSISLSFGAYLAGCEDGLDDVYAGSSKQLHAAKQRSRQARAQSRYDAPTAL